MTDATEHRAAKFIVLPESRETRRNGITWGPFTLAEARGFVHRRGGDGFIVFPEDEHHENPRIWNYVDPDGDNA